MFRQKYPIVLLLTVLGLIVQPARAQSWSNLDRGFNWDVRCLFADTVSDVIYAGGNFSRTGYASDGNGTWAMGIARWNGNNWDSLSCGMNPASNCVINQSNMSGQVLAITTYNNELYAGGGFTFAGGDTAWGIAKWDGTDWTNIGNAENESGMPASVLGFCVNNNELYAVGNFYKIGGVISPKVAKYDGQNWISLPILDSVGGGWTIASATFYNGELYVGGNFDGGNGLKDIARFDGVNWLPVAGGLSGINSWVNTLYVWNNLLHVGGYFHEDEGDPGNSIAAWNGIGWSPLGGGVRPSSVNGMVAFNGHLYVCGQIDSAGAIAVTRMSIWDGVRWCDPGADFMWNGISGSGTPNCMTVLDGVLFVGGAFFTVNSDTVSNICSYTGPFFTSECDTTVGLQEAASLGTVQVYPNPTSAIITFEFLDSRPRELNIYDAFGKEIMHEDVFASAFVIPVQEFASGIYFYSATGENNIPVRGKFIVR